MVEEPWWQAYEAAGPTVFIDEKPRAMDIVTQPTFSRGPAHDSVLLTVKVGLPVWAKLV